MRSYVLEIKEGGEVPSTGRPRPKNLPSLLVAIPQPAPGFESQRMAYELVPHELQYFATSQWVDSPAHMLAPLMTKALATSEVWDSVIQLPSVIRGDYRLEISQVALVQEFIQQPSRVRLTLQAQLATVDDPQVIGTRSFEFQEEAPSENAYGGVQAAHNVVRQFLRELSHWLASCLKNGPLSRC